MRYLVERTRDSFDDVGAAFLELHASGALIFRDDDGELTLIYAPGQWITACPESDA